MELRIFELPPLGTNAYLLLEPARGEAVLFDAPMGAAEAVGTALAQTGCRLTGVYLTHGHWDHMLDAAEFNRQGVPVHVHPADAPLVQDAELQLEYLLPGLGIEPAEVVADLTQGLRLEMLGSPVEVRHVPGHSPGSVLFHFPAMGVALCGDAIFAGGVGRTDLPGCSSAQLTQAIRTQIYTLPDDTTLYPGHGPSTTVGEEKTGNPFVRG